ncbi:hypothetical protein FQV27_06945 [Paracoccus aurantiacus]|uniref:Mitochondrial inner membrane protein n=1 Tax=Paracoccus aurantiacus TaxID=2599412 RepID=A0A5C6S609_9RHOB|nr:hypothetical protein [Paracoccus aurantiacus]TXB69845.1 hypothetical protein FQV27_06945 [Paracoccus aurantiacus]
MVTSDKSSTGNKSKSTGKAAGGKAKDAATGTVVPSKPVDTDPSVTISRIPPSQPIDSNLLGTSGDARPAAARKPVPSEGAEKPVRLTEPAEPTAAGAATLPAGSKAESGAQNGSARVVQRTGFWPVALGGVVAAGLGAAATIYALPHLPESWRGGQGAGTDVAAVKADAVAAATEAARSEVASLREETLATASKAGGDAARAALAEMPPPDDVQIKAFVDEQIKSALAANPAPSAPQPAAPPPANDAAGSSAAAPPSDMMSRISALQDALNAQEQRIEELRARPQLDPAALERVQALAQNADQVKADIENAAAQARDTLATVQTEADAASQRAQAVASVAVLGAVLDGGGGSPTEAVQQLERAGVSVPEPLAQGDLPSLDQLQMGFDAPAREALRVSLKAQSKNEGPLGAVSNFLRVQTGARSVEPREGDDPDAVLSRAAALVQQGELQSALDEIAALPEAGQQAMSTWTEQAHAYLNAEAALNDVAKSLN